MAEPISPLRQRMIDDMALRNMSLRPYQFRCHVSQGYALR
jgi:hypothetical protein